MRCSLVSNKIIQARERLGLTQQQLAEKLCVTNKAVSKWECGVTLPDISLLVPLCRVLGLTVQELLDEYDGKFGNTPGCQTTEDPAQDTLFAAQQHSHYLYIDLKTTSTVSPHLFGHNLEHTRASIMDGLSAQMIRNRKFAGAAARNGVALDCENLLSEIETLRAAGVPVTAMRFQAIIHDFVMLNALDETNACRAAMDASTEWINRKNMEWMRLW